MDKLQLLRDASFGARVAEEETAELASYFVETDQWMRIVRGSWIGPHKLWGATYRMVGSIRDYLATHSV